jgi:hypothetical protein
MLAAILLPISNPGKRTVAMNSEPSRAMRGGHSEKKFSYKFEAQVGPEVAGIRNIPRLIVLIGSKSLKTWSRMRFRVSGIAIGSMAIFVQQRE